MRKIKTSPAPRRYLTRRIAPLILVTTLAVGLAACGSSGGGSGGVNSGGTGGHQNAPTTVAPKSGGAGF